MKNFVSYLTRDELVLLSRGFVLALRLIIVRGHFVTPIEQSGERSLVGLSGVGKTRWTTRPFGTVPLTVRSHRFGFYEIVATLPDYEEPSKRGM